MRSGQAAVLLHRPHGVDRVTADQLGVGPGQRPLQGGGEHHLRLRGQSRHAGLLGRLLGEPGHQPVGRRSHERRVLLLLLEPPQVLGPFHPPEAGPALRGAVAVEGDDEVHHQALHRPSFRRLRSVSCSIVACRRRSVWDPALPFGRRRAGLALGGTPPAPPSHQPDGSGAGGFDLARPPRLVEVGLERAVEAQDQEPSLAGDGLDPVALRAVGGSLRTERDGG